MEVSLPPRPPSRHVDLAAIDRFVNLTTRSALLLINAGAITPDDLDYLSDRVAQSIGTLHPNPNQEDPR